MLTQGKIDKFYKDVESLGLKKKKNATIQKATGFPKSNISEWLRKVKVPSENFIDTFYEKFKAEIEKCSTNVLYKNDNTGSQVMEPDSSYQIEGGNLIFIEVKTASGKTIKVKPNEDADKIAILNAFLEERDRVLEERNRVIEKVETEKQARIDELIKEKENLNNIIKGYLSDIKTNSKEIVADLAILIPEMQAEHRAMMDTMDKAAKQKIGTTSAAADKLELAYQQKHVNKGKAEVDKSGKKS